MTPTIRELGSLKPKIDPSAYIADGVRILGDVMIGKNASIWYNCVVRGDADRIEIGENTNIQDGTIVHVDHGVPCLIAKNVGVGHNAILHGCVIKEGALIGMGAILLSGSEVGEGAVIAAGALVTEGQKIPPRTVWAGIPARQIKEVPKEMEDPGLMNSREYVKVYTPMHRKG